MIELKCEVCGIEFKATKRRSIDVCASCIDKLELLGKGPNQLLGHPDIRPKVINIMKVALGYR
jgi:hypothetical protein